MDKNNKKQVKAKEIPVGAKIISVLYYIAAVYFLIMGIISFVGAGFISDLIPALGEFGPGLLIALGIIMLGLGVLSFFIARGLWRGQNWARIIAIIFAIIGVITTIYSIVQGFGIGKIIEIIISGFIAFYLLFNEEVKSAFA